MIFVQKIIKIGNSYGVIIPRALANYLGWKLGDMVDVSYSSRRKAIIITKEIAKIKLPNG